MHQVIKIIKIFYTVKIGILNFLKLSNPFKTKSLSLFHLNICSLQRHFGSFHILHNELNINLNIIAITVSHVKENVLYAINIQLPNYSIKHTPTEASGGALLYINRLSYKPRADLKMYGPGKLESAFIEIICPHTSNLIIGCTYKHSILHICDFNSNYISPLLHKLSKGSSKHIFLLGDININLPKYESSELVNIFLDTLSSNFLYDLR